MVTLYLDNRWLKISLVKKQAGAFCHVMLGDLLKIWFQISVEEWGGKGMKLSVYTESS